jgi:ATP/maltotriose-dependent transcriptional regulator MalT
MEPEQGVKGMHLVGRERELAEISATWQRSTAGEPSVVVLAGESGVGKTSLVRALLDRVDARVFAGSCIPVGGEAMPFAPVIQALRRLTPEQRAVLPGGWPDVSEDSTDAPVSSSTQVRLFESLLSLLGTQAAEQPVVLLIEDLHRSDRSTLDLISFLARNLYQEPLLIMLTVRSDDLERGHPLRGWLSELVRLAQARRIDVARLDRDHTREQLTSLLRHRPSEAVLDLVFQRSAGNPLFTEQLLPWTADPDGQLPETLHDLVVQRFASLPARTRRALDVASVLGRSCPLPVLATIVGETEDEVEQTLRPAVDRHLFLPAGGAAYAFGHPLFREVLEADLLPGQRRRMHASAAQTLARTGESTAATFDTAAEIARHWEAADVPERAFPAAVQAGLAAERVYAFADADAHLRRAVELAQEVSTDAWAGLSLDRAGLLAHAAQAAHLMGDGERAVELVTKAAEHSEDTLQRARLLEREGAYCFNAGLAERARAAYQAALELLPPDRPSADRARVYAGMGMLAMAWSRMAEAETACRQAIDIARAVGARQEEGRALNALGVVSAYRGEFEDGVRRLRLSVQIAEEIEDPDDLAVAYIDLAHVLGLANRHDDAVSVCRAGYDEMRRVGLVRQEGSFLQANAAESLIKSGRWQEAEALLAEAMAQGSHGLRSLPALTQSARLAVGQGRLADAERLTADIAEMLHTYGAPAGWRREVYEISAELLLWQHRPAQAWEQAVSGLDLAAASDEQRQAGPLVALAARAAADQAEAARAARSTGDLARARDLGRALAERAHAMRPDPLDDSGQPLPQLAALTLTARAELARLDNRSTAELWGSVAARWAAVGQPMPTAYARWREAEAMVLAKLGGERQVAALRTAYALASGLGATALVKEIEQLARWGRISLDAGVSAGAADEGGLEALGLTARERDVLAGLVAGQTNREIADALFISVKTASVHVSNILRKLDVGNREEAARVAHRLGVAAADRSVGR